MSQDTDSRTALTITADDLESLASSEDLRQTVHGGEHTNQTLTDEELATRRQAIWTDLSARHPELGSSMPDNSLAPQAALARRDFDTGRIVFGNGVPVGGNAHLTLYSDGTYALTGHFHDSGAPSYNLTLVFIIADSQGRPISFAHQGRMHGTFESGSRDDNPAGTGNNAMIAQLWNTGLGARWWWSAHVGMDVEAAIASALKALGYVAAVAAIVV